MTSRHQSASALIDQTVRALSGCPSDVSPTDGASVIDGWIGVLGSDNPVASSLGSLKQALQGGSAGGGEISTMLMSLSEQTESAASSADSSTRSSLPQLAQSMKSFSRRLLDRRQR